MPSLSLVVALDGEGYVIDGHAAGGGADLADLADRARIGMIGDGVHGQLHVLPDLNAGDVRAHPR